MFNLYKCLQTSSTGLHHPIANATIPVQRVYYSMPRLADMLIHPSQLRQVDAQQKLPLQPAIFGQNHRHGSFSMVFVGGLPDEKGSRTTKKGHSMESEGVKRG